MMGQQRQAIVQALAAVPGLSVSSTAPDVALSGAAWPVWGSATWSTASQVVGTWYVFVALAAGSHQATVDDSEEMFVAVADALWRVGRVSLVEPYTWQMEPGGQTLPVLRFTLEV